MQGSFSWWPLWHYSISIYLVWFNQAQGLFQAMVVSILLYGCTILMLTKHIKKKLDWNGTRMQQAIQNKISWKQHPTKRQLYDHLPLISKTIQIILTKHVGHCWRSKAELISEVLLRIPSHGHASFGQPTRIYL